MTHRFKHPRIKPADTPRGVFGPVVLLLTVLSHPVHAQAQNNGPTVPRATASRLFQAPAIDGDLGDAIWQGIAPISSFVQHEPNEGQQPTYRTEIRIGFDDDAIYIAARMYDTNPSGILFGENRRDADLTDADALLLVLDTYRDHQNGYVFGTTPSGIEYDGQVVRDGQGGITTGQRNIAGPGAGNGFNLNWDGSWEVATVVDTQGWTAEFRIPFSTLQYGGGEQEWGLNISRTIRRINEEVFWSPVPRIYTLYRVSQAGVLDGIQPPTRRTLRVTPFALTSARKDFVAATDTDINAEFGGDAKVGLTPSMNLDLTINTDFAQVEVDDQQVNLTRFSLFFPEKRPFFLENAGTFSVGTSRSGSDLGLDLFYSRRIGIATSGAPVPILGGGRLTGKVGGVTIGLMDLQTESVGSIAVPANNYSVGRVVKEFPNRSRIGALVIGRLNTDDTDDHNLTYAIDGRIGIGPSFNFDGYISRTSTPGLNGREHGMAFEASYQGRDWDFGAQYREIGEDFNPEVGFLPRSAYRAGILRAQRNIRLESVPWIRELQPHILFRNFFSFDGFNETRYLHIDNAMDLEAGGRISTALNIRREGLEAPFDITAQDTIAAGTYDFVEGVLRFSTNESAALSIETSTTFGGFFSGHRKGIGGTVTSRVGASWIAALEINYDDVDLAEGNFQTTLVSLRTAYSFTPRIFLQSLLQYDDQSDSFSTNVRFGWLSTAGTGLFVVFNDRQRTIDPRGPKDRSLIVKFTRQLNISQ